jgi:hypothetical protein
MIGWSHVYIINGVGNIGRTCKDLKDPAGVFG